MALNITKFIISVLLISLVGIITFSWLMEGNREYDTPFEDTGPLSYLSSYNESIVVNTSRGLQTDIDKLNEDYTALTAGFYLVKNTLNIIKLPFTYLAEAFTAMTRINQALPFIDQRVYTILTMMLTIVVGMLIFQLIINRKVY